MSENTVSSRWWKLQTPMNKVSHTILVYDKTRENMQELKGEVADRLMVRLNMRPVGDRVYVKGTIVDGKFIVDRATITRAPKSW